MTEYFTLIYTIIYIIIIFRWPVEGNTFPTGSCEVRGEARVVEKDARGGKTLDVTPNRLLEWDYAIRQMCKCTHPTLCGDSGILASEEIEGIYLFISLDSMTEYSIIFNANIYYY